MKDKPVCEIWILTLVNMKVIALWDKTLCSVVWFTGVNFPVTYLPVYSVSSKKAVILIDQFVYFNITVVSSVV